MSLDNPAVVMVRLAEVESDMAGLQNEVEVAAWAHYRVRRDLELERAREFVRAEGSVEARRALAVIKTAGVGVEEEARYEALKAKLRVLSDRASIGQSILKAQSRS